MMNVSGVPGNNVASTYDILNRAENIVKEIPEVAQRSKVAGYGFMSGQGSSYGMMILKLKPWSERRYGFWHPIDNFMSTSSMVANAKLNARLMAEIPDAQCFVFEPGMIPGYGMGGIELQLQDKTVASDKEVFYNYTQEFLAKLSQRPEVGRAVSTYARNFPQYRVTVDAAQCKRAGISPASVLSALGSYCGGAYVSNMNQFSKVYRVMLQSAPEYRMTEADLANMFVRNGAEMAPLSQFIKLEQVVGPEIDTRFNLFSSISVNVAAATGYSNTQVMEAIREVKEEVFPIGYDYEFSGMSREEAQTIGSIDTYLIYAVCVLLIFLILSCLYESFLIPFSVIFSVPAGLMGSFGFAWLWNQGYAALPIIFLGQIENNIYLQTGVIMLIGLLAKTAILITEFALERRRKGMGIVEAAFAAAEARLRPILMTVLTMIFGMIPLVLATGAGANGNRTIGLGVIGGMAVGTIAILITVPLFFIIFEWLQERIRPVMHEEVDQQFLKELERSKKEKQEAHEA
jgi:multidrug efflux pump subunit AcrB